MRKNAKRVGRYAHTIIQDQEKREFLFFKKDRYVVQKEWGMGGSHHKIESGIGVWETQCKVFVEHELFRVPTMEWLSIPVDWEETMKTRISPLEIALQRVQQCINGRLDLSKLGLTELPVLPDDLIMLRCDSNELTSLPVLPSSLLVLHCHSNQLTSLPELPPFLESLSCSHNPITSLPLLPSSLIQLVCIRNHLTFLPPLPPTLTELCFDDNNITHLPTLPPHLTSLSCCQNQLTFLPFLPSLHSLFCFANPLETMPELPSTLVYLVCILPHTKERYAPFRLTPEQIQSLNRENQAWAESLSKGRSIDRCATYYEELMCLLWHPDRVKRLLEMGYTPEDM